MAQRLFLSYKTVKSVIGKYEANYEIIEEWISKSTLPFAIQNNIENAVIRFCSRKSAPFKTLDASMYITKELGIKYLKHKIIHFMKSSLGLRYMVGSSRP